MRPRLYTHLAQAIILTRLGRPSVPRACTFLITWACNCRCPYCHVWKRTPRPEMSLSQIKKAFRDLGSLDVIRITGGEPFLRKDLPAVVNHFQDTINPSLIHITTNGSLTDRIVSLVKSVRRPERLHLKVSIDAVGKKQDEIRGVVGLSKQIDSTLKALVRIRKEYGFYLALNLVITPYNKGLLMKVHEYARARGVDIVYEFARKDVLLYQDVGTAQFLENPIPSLEGSYSTKELQQLRRFIETHNTLNNLEERLVDRYFSRGFHNRIVKGKISPQPPCAALSSHIRVLPNGDVPISL